MNELKFGSRVIAWDGDKDDTEKGRFLTVEPQKNYPYSILQDNGGVDFFGSCEIDLEADEFVSGDEVEAIFCGEWEKVIYIGKIDTAINKHIVDHNGFVSLSVDCRYPQQETTIADIAEKLGKDIEQLTLKDIKEYND